jgi:hypothetical protein
MNSRPKQYNSFLQAIPYLLPKEEGIEREKLFKSHSLHFACSVVSYIVERSFKKNERGNLGLLFEAMAD